MAACISSEPMHNTIPTLDWYPTATVKHTGLGIEVAEAWGTDTELQAARSRLTAGIHGYVEPAAFSVARIDGAALAYGHINEPGGMHRLPAAMLASVCGYSSKTGVFRISRDDLISAIELLTPAEAATHMDHPNLWSWRELMKGVRHHRRAFQDRVAAGPDQPAVRPRSGFPCALTAFPCAKAVTLEKDSDSTPASADLAVPLLLLPMPDPSGGSGR